MPPHTPHTYQYTSTPRPINCAYVCVPWSECVWACCAIDSRMGLGLDCLSLSSQHTLHQRALSRSMQLSLHFYILHRPLLSLSRSLSLSPSYTFSCPHLPHRIERLNCMAIGRHTHTQTPITPTSYYIHAFIFGNFYIIYIYEYLNY